MTEKMTLHTDTKVKENSQIDKSFINRSKEIVVLPNDYLTISKEKVKQKELPKYWDKEYINERIDRIKNYKHKMMCQFLWFTGVRITEAISIKKKDVDFNNYTVRIKWQKNRKYVERQIPLHPRLKDMLIIYTAHISLENRVFPVTRQGAWYVVKKCMNGHPHQFRHSFAVNWLRCGGELVVLSRMLGHSNIQSTMEYLKIVPLDVGKELLKIQFW